MRRRNLITLLGGGAPGGGEVSLPYTTLLPSGDHAGQRASPAGPGLPVA